MSVICGFRLFPFRSILAVFGLLCFASYGLAQGTIDHFLWNSAPLSAQAAQPFSAILDAVDATNGLLTAYSGAATLSASMPGPMPTIAITEINTAPGQTVELSNVSGNSVDVSGWRVVFYDDLSWPAPRTTFTIPSGTVCPGGGVFVINGSGATPGAYPSFSTGVTLNWATYFPNAGVLVLDAAGNAVDFFCTGLQAVPGLINVPFPITSDIWSGPGFADSQPYSGLDFQRIGYMNDHSAADWVQATNSIGSLNQGLVPPFLPDQSFLPISPDQVTFTNGQWSGLITIGSGGSNIVLRADDQIGHSGDSLPFAVGPLPALSLQIPSAAFKATSGLVGTGSISLAQPLTNSITATLSNSSASEIGVPSILIISTGQTNVQFNVTNYNDGLLTGPLAITIVATAPGFAPASAIITNYDQNPPALSLSLPSSLYEGTTGSAQVFSSAPPVAPVHIRLASTLPGRLQAPDFVILPAGQTSLSFSLITPSTGFILSNQPVTITASVGGWTAAQGEVLVANGKPTSLRVSLPYLPTSDLVFDPATQMIFASVPPSPQGWSNCVVGLNPQTGLVGSSFQVGNIPDQFGIARVGQDLYVGLDQNSTVQRIETVTGQLYSPFSIGINSGYEAYSIDVMPGAPQTVAIANFYPPWTQAGAYGAFGSTTIYDNGVPRSDTIFAGFVEFSSDGSLLYSDGWFSNFPDFGGDSFTVNRVTANGLTNLAQWAGGTIDVGLDVANGTNYFPDGTIIDTKSLVMSRLFLGVNNNSAERLNPANNDIFFLFAGYTNWFLQRFDRSSHALLNSLVIPNIAGGAGNLILSGTNSLAFRTTGDQIFLIQTSQIPAVPQLAVTQSISPLIGTVGSNVNYTVVVTNGSAVAATGVQLTDTLPPGATFVSGNAPQGAFTQSQGVVTFSLGTLSNYSAVIITIVAQPGGAGFNLNSNVVTADLYDLSSGQNISTQIQEVNTAITPPYTTEILDLPISDMIYDPSNQVVLASVIGGPLSNTIAAIDVHSSTVLPIVHLTNQPGVLALSDDSQYLYVGLTDGTGVDRINRSNNLIDLQFPLNAPGAQWQPYAAQNMSVMPGNHDAVAIAPAGWSSYNSAVAIFDAGIEETNVIYGSSESPEYFDIAFSSPTNLDLLSPFGFETALVTTNGVVASSPVYGGFSGNFVTDGALVFTSAGQVINPQPSHRI